MTQTEKRAETRRDRGKARGIQTEKERGKGIEREIKRERD